MAAAFSPMRSPDGKERIREKLFTKVIEAVKSCQSAFGGKSQLAADTDTTVSILLLRLESLIQHGLKQKLSKTVIDGAFRQMSELSGINLNYMKPEITEEAVFWNFIRTFLTKHELERFENLKNVTSDYARGRAWLRATLNEHSLDKYVSMILADPANINLFYEPHAFLLDTEKAGTLPQVISSLNNIYFALQIDTSELETGRILSSIESSEAASSEILNENLQPVYCSDAAGLDGQTPDQLIANERKKKKRKKRLAKIEEEAGKKNGSTRGNGAAAAGSSRNDLLQSDPSLDNSNTPDLIPIFDRLDLNLTMSRLTGMSSRTSESSTQDSLDQDQGAAGSSSFGEIPIEQLFPPPGSESQHVPSHGPKPRPTGHHRSQSDDSNIALNKQVPVKSMQLSSSTGDSNSSISGAVTVGGKNLSMNELKQATLDMMRRKDDFERENHVLQDTLRQERLEADSLHQQISQHKSAAESASRLNEETEAGLRRELDILKSQLKKYVSAVHVLKNDRQSLVHSALGEDNGIIGSAADGVDVEDAYEQKLVQMAVMHAELMEFNEQLQSQLMSRDRQIHQLQNEVNVLRGPLPDFTSSAASSSSTAATGFSSILFRRNKSAVNITALSAGSDRG